MEEPYDNPNAYTHHHMLRAMNADGVKVVVTGAGGDEVFAAFLLFSASAAGLVSALLAVDAVACDGAVFYSKK